MAMIQGFMGGPSTKVKKIWRMSGAGLVEFEKDHQSDQGPKTAKWDEQLNTLFVFASKQRIRGNILQKIVKHQQSLFYLLIY